LRQAIDQGLRNGWWTQLERSPHVMRLHDEAEFQALLDEIRLDMHDQLESLQKQVPQTRPSPLPL
jgi:hypothetical protein